MKGPAWREACDLVHCCSGWSGARGPTPCVHARRPQIPELKAAGVDKVVCVTVGDPEAVSKWARDNGFDKDDMVRAAAARGGGMRPLQAAARSTRPRGPVCACAPGALACSRCPAGRSGAREERCLAPPAVQHAASATPAGPAPPAHPPPPHRLPPNAPTAQTLCVLADKDQCFMRMLGLEMSDSGPPCQRFAGVVDNGILLRLKVEGTPGDLQLTAVQSMLSEFKQFFDI